MTCLLPVTSLSKGTIKLEHQQCNHKKKSLIYEVCQNGRMLYGLETWVTQLMTLLNIFTWHSLNTCMIFSYCCSTDWISYIFSKYRVALVSICYFQKPKIKCVLRFHESIHWPSNHTNNGTFSFPCSWLVAKLLTKTKETCYTFHCLHPQ